ncbi:hypothetical protein QVZ43_15405 [Marinobacter sp. chi1]|uniref:Uncharacterized protein n=1 Tax=Marinobacter suaedae TaxID=3057675 RepID=A0ABT8W4D9_9GAMM|nr:hypothetical protein [Marinobacter sp. chi1]MDO3723110.1 hypothetical protein [Marinobacter sp. chi1]
MRVPISLSGSPLFMTYYLLNKNCIVASSPRAGDESMSHRMEYQALSMVVGFSIQHRTE